MNGNPYALSSTSRSRTLSFTHKDEEDTSIIEVEVPGVDINDIVVKLEGKQLLVTTPRGNLILPLGTRVDPANSTAHLKNGLLSIRIPKRSASVVEVKVTTD